MIERSTQIYKQALETTTIISGGLEGKFEYISQIKPDSR